MRKAVRPRPIKARPVTKTDISVVKTSVLTSIAIGAFDACNAADDRANENSPAVDCRQQRPPQSTYI